MGFQWDEELQWVLNGRKNFNGFSMGGGTSMGFKWEEELHWAFNGRRRGCTDLFWNIFAGVYGSILEYILVRHILDY